MYTHYTVPCVHLLSVRRRRMQDYGDYDVGFFSRAYTCVYIIMCTFAAQINNCWRLHSNHWLWFLLEWGILPAGTWWRRYSISASSCLTTKWLLTLVRLSVNFPPKVDRMWSAKTKQKQAIYYMYCNVQSTQYPYSLHVHAHPV